MTFDQSLIQLIAYMTLLTPPSLYMTLLPTSGVRHTCRVPEPTLVHYTNYNYTSQKYLHISMNDTPN